MACICFFVFYLIIILLLLLLLHSTHTHSHTDMYTYLLTWFCLFLFSSISPFIVSFYNTAAAVAGAVAAALFYNAIVFVLHLL